MYVYIYIYIYILHHQGGDAAAVLGATTGLGGTTCLAKESFTKGVRAKESFTKGVRAKKPEWPRMQENRRERCLSNAACLTLTG